MGMRKYGQRDGEVTGVEQDQGLSRQAAAGQWGEADDQGLADENAAADGEQPAP